MATEYLKMISDLESSEDEDQISEERISVSLPVEVLAYILEYIPLSDRISASQVSHIWYEASKDFKLNKNKVVILRHNLQKALQVLENSDSVFLHFVFKDVELNNRMSSFWKKFCPQMLSLTFNHCDLSEKTFMNILSKCPLLQALHIVDCRELLMSGRVLEVESDIASVKQHLTKLTQLSLDYNRYMSDALFNRFVAISPNLEVLSLRGCQISFHYGLYKKFYPVKMTSSGETVPSESVLTFNNILQFIEQQAHKIKKLNFGSTLIDNTALSKLVKVHNLRLTSVHLEACDQLNNNGIVTLSEHQTSITELNLSMCSRITDHALISICNNLVQLEVLNLSNCHGISNIGVSELCKLKNLTSLNLAQCQWITGEGIQNGLCSYTRNKLHSLWLTSLNLDEQTVCNLSEHLPNLKLLNLAFCFIAVTDKSIQAICRNQIWLRTLILTGCEKITDAGLTGMGVSMDSVRVNGSVSESSSDMLPSPVSESYELAECMRQKVSDIRNGRKLSDPMHRISLRSRAEQDIVNDAKRKKVVSQICEGQYHSTNKTEDSISNLKGLQHLDLSGCNRITDVSLKHVFWFRELQHLNLSHCQQVSFIGLSYFAMRNPSIETLLMNHCYNITDNGIMSFSKCSFRLKHLELQGCKQLTDASLDALAQNCKNLKCLNLNYCTGMSLEGVQIAEKCLPSLQSLSTVGLAYKSQSKLMKELLKPVPPPLPSAGFRFLRRNYINLRL